MQALTDEHLVQQVADLLKELERRFQENKDKPFAENFIFLCTITPPGSNPYRYTPQICMDLAINPDTAGLSFMYWFSAAPQLVDIVSRAITTYKAAGSPQSIAELRDIIERKKADSAKKSGIPPISFGPLGQA